jgi:hypothetical protein
MLRASPAASAKRVFVLLLIEYEFIEWYVVLVVEIEKTSSISYQLRRSNKESYSGKIVVFSSKPRAFTE